MRFHDGHEAELLTEAVDADDLNEERRRTQCVREDKAIHLLYFLDMLFEWLSDTDLMCCWTETVRKGYDAACR